MARASKLIRNKSGKLVSAKSKTGMSECSQAMSAWKTSGMTAAIAATLGRCRAIARRKKMAADTRAAGNEARAQHYEAIAERGGPITQKDRLARARELRAQRAQRQAAGRSTPPPAPTPTLREQAAAARAKLPGLQSDPAARMEMARQLKEARAAIRNPVPISAVSEKQRAYAEDVRRRRIDELLRPYETRSADHPLGRLRLLAPHVEAPGRLAVRRAAGEYLRRTRAKRYRNLVQAGKLARIGNARDILGP